MVALQTAKLKTCDLSTMYMTHGMLSVSDGECNKNGVCPIVLHVAPSNDLSTSCGQGGGTGQLPDKWIGGRKWPILLDRLLPAHFYDNGEQGSLYDDSKKKSHR